MAISLTILFLIATGYQLYFWVYRLDKVNSFKTEDSHDYEPPAVSLVIAVKNEANHVHKHLLKWLSQDYRNYEIIIVDDHSTDNTAQILKSNQHKKLTILSLPKEQKGKKMALSMGILKANSEWILVTDGDCFPNSDSWISSMMSHSAQQDVILGYGPYLKTSGLLNKWIRYETWFVAMQFLSAAITRRTYMGVGRNMAFKKAIYEKVGGYQSHMDIKGGDDDLLITSFDLDTRYGIVTDRNSWVWSYAETSFKDYLNQKRRHLSTAPRYNQETKLRLMFDYISQLMWYVTTIWLCMLNPLWLLAFGARYLIIFSIHLRSKTKLGDLIPSVITPFFDIFLCVLYFFLSFTYFKTKKEW